MKEFLLKILRASFQIRVFIASKQVNLETHIYTHTHVHDDVHLIANSCSAENIEKRENAFSAHTTTTTKQSE